MTKVKCSACRFWRPDAGADTGECLRHAPSPALGVAQEQEHRRLVYWPVTVSNDGCGEYRAPDGEP
jgi:hypothetical protein